MSKLAIDIYTDKDSFQTRFLTTVSGSSIEDFLMDFSSVSHIAGSDDDYEQALKTQTTYLHLPLRAKHL
jgi:hypothetical protein